MAIRWAALAIYVGVGWLLCAATPLELVPSLLLVCALAALTAFFTGHRRAVRRELDVDDPPARDRSRRPEAHGLP